MTTQSARSARRFRQTGASRSVAPTPVLALLPEAINYPYRRYFSADFFPGANHVAALSFRAHPGITDRLRAYRDSVLLLLNVVR